MPHIDLKNIQQSEPIAGFSGRFVHTENSTMAFWEVKAHAVLPEHTHMHEQVSIVTKGSFELSIEGEKKILKPGMIAVIPSNAKHYGRAITDCEIIDTFHPVREDYK